MVDTPAVVNTPVAVDNGTTGGIKETLDALNDKYEVQEWENLDNSGLNVGTMAGDNSLNSGNNTYLGTDFSDIRGIGDSSLGYDPFGGSSFGGSSGGGKGNMIDNLSVSEYAKGGAVNSSRFFDRTNPFGAGMGLNAMYSGFGLPDMSRYGGRYANELSTQGGRDIFNRDVGYVSANMGDFGIYKPTDLNELAGAEMSNPNTKNIYADLYSGGNSYFIPDYLEADPYQYNYHLDQTAGGKTRDQQNAGFNRMYGGQQLANNAAFSQGFAYGDTGTANQEGLMRDLLNKKEDLSFGAQSAINDGAGGNREARLNDMYSKYAGELAGFDVGRGDLTYDQGHALTKAAELQKNFDNINYSMNQRAQELKNLQDKLVNLRVSNGNTGTYDQMKADYESRIAQTQGGLEFDRKAQATAQKNLDPYLKTVSEIQNRDKLSSSEVLGRLFPEKVGFAKGGRVKTHFQTGGANQATDIDQMAENYGVAPQADIMSYQGSKLFPMQGQATAPVSDQMTRRDAYPPTTQSPMDARATQLDALLQRYAGNTTDYSAELAEARKTANTESMAFQKMIQDAMKGSADEAPSKAEMYFRLASAFGSPTKTGHFAETLGNVNKELAAYSKEERDARKAQRALQLQMGLKGQEMRMASAKDDLTTLKTLAAEGMKDKRAITAEVIKDFIKSGEPESAAGKQARDEGLRPGSKEFQARVSEIAQTSVDAKLAQVTATLAGMSVQQANQALAMSKFENQKAQQSKLSPQEMKLKSETEDILTSTDQAMADLKRAYQLNPNTFDTSLGDIAQRKVLETAGSKDPKVIATREQTNLLSKSAVGKLKTAFGGNPTEGERKILLDLEGIDSKSKEERAIIMRNSYTALKNRREREQKRLNDIKQGLYRDTSAPSGELE